MCQCGFSVERWNNQVLSRDNINSVCCWLILILCEILDTGLEIKHKRQKPEKEGDTKQLTRTWTRFYVSIPWNSYKAIKKNEVLIQTTAWVGFKNIVLK